MTQSCNTQTVQHTWELHLTRDIPGKDSRAEAKARRKLALLRKLAGTQWGAAETVLRNVYNGTIRSHLELIP